MERESNVSIMWRMLGLVKPLAGVMTLAIACGVIGFCCATFLPVLAVRGGLAAAGFGEPFGLSLTGIAVALAVMAVARGVLHYAEQTCNHYIAFKLLASIRDRVFANLRKLCPAKLAGADRGDLISRLTADVELLEVFYAHTISPIIIAVLMSVIMVVFMGSYHLLFGVVAAAAYLVVGAAVPVWISKSAGDAGMRGRKQAGRLSSFVLDSLRGLREVKQYNAGERRLATLDAESRALTAAQEVLAVKAGLGSAATNALILVFSLGQVACGAALASSGAVAPEAALIVSVALFSSFGPVVALANLGTTLQGTLASGRRVLDILDEEPLVEDNLTGVEISFDGAAAEHVDFSYGDEQILHDVNVAVTPGAIVGVTGRSGSGKSTLCRLFMRFWDVEAGRIALSDADVRDMKTSSLRAAEAFVEQDTYLFHDSIRDNLRIVRPDATQEQIEEACKAASIHDFIMSLPNGYDTMVGELGDTLSGGERQRMGLARAFLHDAPFLLLDEPTSNLDSLNEGAVLRSLDAQRGNRTVLLISHRASTMNIADTTIAMNSGRVS